MADPRPAPAARTPPAPRTAGEAQRRNERGWILVAVLAAAGIGAPMLVIEAHEAIDRQAPDTIAAGPLLTIAALAGGFAVGAPFLVERRPGPTFVAILCSGVVGAVILAAAFQDYGNLGGLGLILFTIWGGGVAGLGLLAACVAGALTRFGPRPGLAVAGAWVLAWGACALAMLVTLPHQAAAAAYANRPRSSPPAGVVVALATLVAAAWARRPSGRT